MSYHFYAPHIETSGSYCFTVVCLHKLNVKTQHFPITPKLITVTRLIFGMKAHLINMHLLVPRSRSSAKVKVKYQGFISQRIAISGSFMFHKQILFFFRFPAVVNMSIRGSTSRHCYALGCVNGDYKLLNRQQKPRHDIRSAGFQPVKLKHTHTHTHTHRVPI